MNALNVLFGAFVIESVGKGQILRVIGDGHVLVSAFTRSQRHFLNGAAAIGFNGMHVDVALNVTLFNQVGKRMPFSGLNFSTVLAQFGSNIVEAEPGIDFFFRGAGYALDDRFGAEGREREALP